MAVKGAPDVLLARCTHLLGAQGPRPSPTGTGGGLPRRGATMAGQALRVLAVAQRDCSPPCPKSMAAESLEAELTFVGLIGMMDPPRPEVQAGGGPVPPGRASAR